MFQQILFDPAALVAALPSADNPFSAMFLILTNGGWIVFPFIIVWGAWVGWIEYIRNKFDASIEFVLLAIDIPQMNELSPKAVEQIFAHLYGIKKSGDLIERYIEGYNQMGISLEIVSIEGYIQFLIHTPAKFRDLVEAAVYAQYPDAEITEVEDYIDMIPHPEKLADSEWDIYGTEMKLTKPELYPIRTYPMFEHSLSKRLLDPLASMMEIMSRMGPGEQLWIQIVAAPVDDEWREKGLALINKLIGKKSDKKGVDLMYFPKEVSRGFIESFTASIIPPSDLDGGQTQKKEREWPSQMQHLSPDERDIVENIGIKISKLGFKSKVRFVYAAHKSVFKKSKGVSGVIGAFQQYSTPQLNGLKKNKKTETKVHYAFIKSRTKSRKKRILYGYRYRSMKRGRKGYILNIEELASLWHFPTLDVKVASLQTVSAKKGQPPASLPVESFTRHHGAGIGEVDMDKSAPPDNLPM